MTWFETLLGFPETGPEDVRRQITLEGERLTSRANGRTFVWGRLETPSLGELRDRSAPAAAEGGPLRVREVVAGVAALHCDPANAGALFQVASQFNLLEMAGPSVTPEQGVGIYEHDPTQGPACAVAAGAGTIYRNYFVPVEGRPGQSRDRQIDCLAGLGAALGNAGGRLWRMRNGYAQPTAAGLDAITARLQGAGAAGRDELRRLLRIGLQWDTQVTLGGATHLVSQAYCSALPVAYSHLPAERWEAFATLVLEAAYEATLAAALENRARTGTNRVFLTLLGGGAFGNPAEWIVTAARRALERYRDRDLELTFVSYRSPSPAVQELLREFSQ